MKTQNQTHTQNQTDNFLPDGDLLQWVETSQLLFRSPDNYNTHALFFWGRYTETLMQKFSSDPENLAFMQSHLGEFRGRRAA